MNKLCDFCHQYREFPCTNILNLNDCLTYGVRHLLKSPNVNEIPPLSHPVPPAADIINRPAHYTKWKVEPITYIMRNGMEFWRGNVIKYASRAGSKLYDGMDEVQSEITDLKKVMRYCEMRINQLNGETVL